jgi:hypothetical protein
MCAGPFDIADIEAYTMPGCASADILNIDKKI